MKLSKGGRPRRTIHPGLPVFTTLEQLGITKRQSSEWQRLARLVKEIGEEAWERELPSHTGKRTSVQKILRKFGKMKPRAKEVHTCPKCSFRFSDRRTAGHDSRQQKCGLQNGVAGQVQNERDKHGNTGRERHPHASTTGQASAGQALMGL